MQGQPAGEWGHKNCWAGNGRPQNPARCGDLPGCGALAVWGRIAPHDLAPPQGRAKLPDGRYLRKGRLGAGLRLPGPLVRQPPGGRRANKFLLGAGTLVLAGQPQGSLQKMRFWQGPAATGPCRYSASPGCGCNAAGAVVLCGVFCFAAPFYRARVKRHNLRRLAAAATCWGTSCALGRARAAATPPTR